MTSTAKVLPLVALVLSLAASAQATSFDITSIGDFDGNFYHSAAGTSSGIGWTVSGSGGDLFYSWGLATTTDATYQGFTGANFVPSLPDSDRLHTFGTDMTITFDTKISSILFYLKEDGGASTLDFGLTPTLVSGSATIVGTSVKGSVSGGVIRYSGLDTDTLTSLTSIFDGMDTAWVVESTTVPDAGSSGLLLGISLAGLGWLRRKSSSTATRR